MDGQRAAKIDLTGRRVLVTGGTGGIGGRLVERLVLECNAHVRVLARNLARTPRVARLPVELLQGDVMQQDSLLRAAEQCDMVFHCARGDVGDLERHRRVNIEGTRNVMEACARSGVARVVHASTCRVFGMLTPDTDLDETAPKHYSGDFYSDSKLDAENVVYDYVKNRGVRASIIQPTTVYGPFVQVWTQNVLDRLKKGRIVLVNGGDGLCNAVYVDDVVTGMLLAATREEAIGEDFLISGPAPITWRRFYEEFGRLLGGLDAVEMTVAEAGQRYEQQQRERRRKGVFGELLRILKEDKVARKRIRNTREVAALVETAKRMLPEAVQSRLRTPKPQKKPMQQNAAPKMNASPERPLMLPTPEQAQFMAAKTHFRIDKARRLLGYEPQFDFASGMQLTAAWARWANLVPHKAGEAAAADSTDGVAVGTAPRQVSV